MTLNEFDDEKAKIITNYASFHKRCTSLKKKLKKKKDSLSKVVNIIKDAKQKVFHFLNTSLKEIVVDSYEDTKMLAYSDIIEKCMDLSFP